MTFNNYDALLGLTGGSGHLPEEISSADIMEIFLLKHELLANRLTRERKARNTVENARLSHALTVDKRDGQWMIVTSAFHMPRAMRSFSRAGWENIVEWPVNFRSAAFSKRLGWDMAAKLLNINLALNEYLGLAVYGLTRR